MMSAVGGIGGEILPQSLHRGKVSGGTVDVLCVGIEKKLG